MPSTPLSRILNANHHVILSPRGIDQFGIYLEFIQLGGPLKDRVYEYTRMLAVDRHVYAYQRDPAKSRTTWKKLRSFATPKLAQEYIQKHFDSGNRILVGTMILVQLEASDLKQIADGQVPGARYRGLNHFKRLFPDYDGSPGQTAMANVPMSTVNIERAVALATPKPAEPEPIDAKILGGSAPATPPASSGPGWTGSSTPPSILGGTGKPLSWSVEAEVHDAIKAAEAEFGEEPY